MSNEEKSLNAQTQAISELSRRELQEAFDKYDADNSGIVTIKNLKQILRSLGFEPSNDEINLLTSRLVESKKRRKVTQMGITFDELVEVLSEKLDERNGIDEIRSAFNLFDTDSKGFITIEDLRSVARELGENIGDEQLREMIMEADTRGAGNVNEDDFCTVMKKTSLY